MVRWSSLFSFLAPPRLAFSGSSAPPPMPANVPPPPPMLNSPQGLQASNDAQRRAAGARGFGSTLLTSGLGDTTAPNVAGNKLLGQ